MSFCSRLPVPDELWSKPHTYGTIGLFIGIAFCFLRPDYPHFDAWMKALFGRWRYHMEGAFFAFLGVMAGQIVALLVRISCG